MKIENKVYEIWLLFPDDSQSLIEGTVNGSEEQAIKEAVALCKKFKADSYEVIELP